MRVVKLGAICDLSPIGNDLRQASFIVSEFAVLENGECIILHSDRGFTGVSTAGDVWAHQSVEGLARDVLTTVLPDDPDTRDEHPWNWLVELLQRQGVKATVRDLRQVPYEVVLTDDVLKRLPSIS